MKILIKNKITVAYLAIILIVASALIVALFNRQPFVAHASEIGIDTKVVSRATIEENFTDNAVIVVLNDKPRNFRQYTAEDFAEVNAVEVMNLSARTGDLVQRQIAAERTGDRRSIQSYIDNNMLVNTDTFRTILMVQLAERSKENVLNAIRILEQRDDIVAQSRTISNVRQIQIVIRAQWVRILQERLETLDLRMHGIDDGQRHYLVGVIDTGIDGAHPDLTNKLTQSMR